MALLLGRPICLRDEDCTLHFPTEVDDEYITLNGILPQPPGKTAVVSGLNYISRIFALLGEILVRVRVDKRSPPALNGGGGGGGREDTSLPREGAFWIKTRLDEVKALHARVCGALVHAPKPLQLNRKVNFAGHAGASTSSSSASSSGASLFDANALNGDAHADSEDRLAMEEEYEYGGAGFKRARMGEVKDFFDNPNASRKNASNCFLVMQANLYVTQVGPSSAALALLWGTDGGFHSNW